LRITILFIYKILVKESYNDNEFSRVLSIKNIERLKLFLFAIAIIDFNRFNSIIVYITFLFMIGVVVLYRPDIYLIIFICANLFFIYKISFLDIERSRIFAIEINATIFVVFSWCVSRIQYLNEYEKYKKDKTILGKNKILEIKNNEFLILSTIDSLTGLYNRRELENVLKKLSIKYEGYSFRYGGDEFCIVTTKENVNLDLINEINNNDYIAYIKNVDLSINMNLSIGSFSDIPDSMEIDKYIDLADHILYGNKRVRRLRKSDYNRI
jgi:GGDEF domain-containing protein